TLAGPSSLPAARRPRRGLVRLRLCHDLRSGCEGSTHSHRRDCRGMGCRGGTGVGYGALLSPGRLNKTRIALRLANRVICVSEATREAVLRIVSRSLSVIPPGIDVSFFRPSGLERRAQVVCVAGVDNVVRYRVKGVDGL